jgi:choline dehydrogenase-like flavoprotein
MYHGFCNRGGCHVDAKNSTAVTTIPRAQATGKLKVVTSAHVTTIEVGSDGLPSGVNYLTDGVEYFQPAKVVLLAGYTYENVRLLLLSTSKAFPNGLSNNHHQVGRHYFSHHQGAGCVGAVSVQHQRLVRPPGAGHCRGQLGGRQLRSRPARFHRRRQSVGVLGSPSRSAPPA